MRRARALVAAAVLAAPLAAQQPDDDDERWCAPPSARSATVVPGAAVDPADGYCLTPVERLRLLGRQAIDPMFHTEVVLSAGWGQLVRDPAPWGRDWRGFGRRLEVEAVTWVTYASVEALVAGVLDVDPRPTFARLADGRPAFGTAVLNGVTLRRRDGRRVPAFPGIVGAAASGWAFWSLRPEGANAGRIATDAATSFAIATVTHVAAEYWRWWRRPGRGAPSGGAGATTPR